MSGLQAGFVSFVLCAGLSWIVGYPVRRWLAGRGIVDLPNERSLHTRATVRGGGIGIIAVIIGGTVGLSVVLGPSRPLPLISFSALALAAVSFVDDKRSVSRAIRFGCHVLAAFAALYALDWPIPRLGLQPSAEVLLPLWLGLSLCILWMAGYTNAFNFMDGIDGIAAGQAAVTAVGAALIAGFATGNFRTVPILLACIVGGAAAGFLPHNFPRARMFMGDVGSAPLGFLLAALALWLAKEHGWWLLVPLTLLHANFVLDTAITLVRRVLRGEKWYLPHREHFYQRLVRSGYSHEFVTGCEMGLQGLVVVLMLLYLGAGIAGRAALILAVLATWALFFGFAEHTFRRREASLVAHQA